MINPTIHTLMVAQSYYMGMEYATPQDCIDVAAKSLFEDQSAQQDAAYTARKAFNDTGRFTDAISATYNDIAKRNRGRAV